MKKILSLLAGVMFTLTASAVSTPYKNLYVEAGVGSGSGLVYLDVNEEDDRAFVYGISEDIAENVFLKATIGENGTESNTGGVNSGVGRYFAKLYVYADAGYELVALTDKVKEDGVYTNEDCFAVHKNGVDTFDYTCDDETPLSINVNNMVTHPNDDGNSDTPGRDAVFAKWTGNESVDTHIYAIFRKVGDEFPKVVITEPNPNDHTSNVKTKDNALYAPQMLTVVPGETIELPLMLKTTDEVAGIEFKVELPEYEYVVTPADPETEMPEVKDYIRPEWLAGDYELTDEDVFTYVVDNLDLYNRRYHVVAFSEEVDAIEGKGEQMVVLYGFVPEDMPYGYYDIKINSVILANTEGKATKIDGDVIVTMHVASREEASVEKPAVSQKPASRGVFSITGVRVVDANKAGLYIKDGKKILVK